MFLLRYSYENIRKYGFSLSIVKYKYSTYYRGVNRAGPNAGRAGPGPTFLKPGWPGRAGPKFC